MEDQHQFFPPEWVNVDHGLIRKRTMCKVDDKKVVVKKTTKSSGGGGGCFLAGTKVTTPNGYVDIDQIKEGDMILSYNEETEMKRPQ